MCAKIKYIQVISPTSAFTQRGYWNLNYMSDKPDLTDTHGTLHPTDTYYFQEPNEHITKRIYIGPLGKLKLFQRTEIMQGILRDCNGLTVYGPSNFTQHVVMI